MMRIANHFAKEEEVDRRKREHEEGKGGEN